jgi:hypothetical protein
VPWKCPVKSFVLFEGKFYLRMFFVTNKKPAQKKPTHENPKKTTSKLFLGFLKN